MIKIFAIVLICVLYVLLPLDLIPDFIPLLGRFDDLIALAATAILLWRKFRLPQAGPDAQKKPGGGEDPGSPQEMPAACDPRDVLGIGPKAGPDEIRKAYREMMSQYHPDKVAHLGEELQQTAQRKTLEIQKALERLLPP